VIEAGWVAVVVVVCADFYLVFVFHDFSPFGRAARMPPVQFFLRRDKSRLYGLKCSELLGVFFKKMHLLVFLFGVGRLLVGFSEGWLVCLFL